MKKSLTVKKSLTTNAFDHKDVLDHRDIFDYLIPLMARNVEGIIGRWVHIPFRLSLDGTMSNAGRTICGADRYEHQNPGIMRAVPASHDPPQ